MELGQLEESVLPIRALILWLSFVNRVCQSATMPKDKLRCVQSEETIKIALFETGTDKYPPSTEIFFSGYKAV